MDEVSISGFLDRSRQLRHEVDGALDRYSQFDADCPEGLRQAIRHSLLAPGKRLRPLLVLISAEACGYDSRAAMPAACAVEMVHTYSLIHDDLPAMDDDDMRRGLPSCHAKFGEAMAILAGDALLARAFEILAMDLDAEKAAAACRELAAAAGASALVGGQADDLSFEFRRGDVAELEGIHRRKTGAMIRICPRLGGIVAGSDEPTLEQLDAYGRNIGLAFQIIDDLLDLKGDEATLGKRAQKDAGRGKLTFPALLGVQESKRRAQHLIEQACAALTPFGSQASGLEALARYVLDRNR